MHGYRDWVSLLAAIGHLSIAVTALRGGKRSAIARPLAALCFVLFGWNFSTLANHVIHGEAFNVLDAAFTALSPPLLLEVVLTFVGRKRRWRIARALSWLLFGGLAAASLGGAVSPRLLAWIDEASWAIVFMCGWLPSLVLEVLLLVRHLSRTHDPREKARARIVLAAVAIGAAFSTTDVAGVALGIELPYLGAIGTLIAAALLATLVVRHELFESNVPARTGVYVTVMIGTFVTLYLVAFRAFAGSLATQAFATVVVTLLVVAAARELAMGLATTQERTKRLAVLGRFSAQMAHDIKSPLTALLGAVQVLDGEKDEKARKELLDLVADQAKRVAAIVDRYDRMGRIEPRKSLVRVNEIARAVARARGIVDDRVKLDPRDPECDADPDLLESAVENVVRNAIEATKERGEVRVETELVDGAVIVRVKDTGAGMDARQLERAFEDFYTTKPEGSGLGLAFTRRVMLAHGGDASMTSEVGVGTTVELRIPIS